MKMVFQQKVQEKESKLKQSEEELYARHKEMKEALDKQRVELEDKKRRVESGRLTPDKPSVRIYFPILCRYLKPFLDQVEGWYLPFWWSVIYFQKLCTECTTFMEFVLLYGTFSPIHTISPQISTLL